jgi:hypothetical protein
MLRIEIDMFSGRPNPAWIISDKAAERLLGEVAETEGAAAKQGAGYLGLGFREVRVDALSYDGPRRRGVPQHFALASTASADLEGSSAIARRLVENMPIRSQIFLVEHAITPLDAKLRAMILDRVTQFLADPPPGFPPGKPPRRPTKSVAVTVPDERCPACQYEEAPYNPVLWNSARVQGNNNCYNYACNRPTTYFSFAQPGRAHGASTTLWSCPTVTSAAMADGLRGHCDCQQSSESPRWLTALVIDPGVDFHWYRRHVGGFWGHKPHSSPASNVDRANMVITNPETCSRGPYIQFCGYFYSGRSVVIS